MNLIPIGKYIPGKSWFHNINPSTKIISIFIIMLCIFIVPVNTNYINIYILVFLLFLSFTVVISCKLPLIKILAGLRPILFLITFTVFIQILYVQGDSNNIIGNFTFNISLTSVPAILAWLLFYNLTKRKIRYRVSYFLISLFLVFYLQYILYYGNLYSYSVTLYQESLIRSLFIFLRIVNLIILTSILTHTTKTTELNQGLEKVLKPFKLIKLPVESIAMMISLTLRFIPTLLEETDKIIKAQASRGLDFKYSKLNKKIKQIISLLIPIFVISFQRSEDLANAMEVRGYVVGEERTSVDTFKSHSGDYILISCTILVFFVILVLTLI